MRTRRLLVVDEDYRSFGMSAEVMARRRSKAPSTTSTRRRPGSPIPTCPFRTAARLEQFCLPGREPIARAARELLGR